MSASSLFKDEQEGENPYDKKNLEGNSGDGKRRGNLL